MKAKWEQSIRAGAQPALAPPLQMQIEPTIMSVIQLVHAAAMLQPCVGHTLLNFMVGVPESLRKRWRFATCTPCTEQTGGFLVVNAHQVSSGLSSARDSLKVSELMCKLASRVQIFVCGCRGQDGQQTGNGTLLFKGSVLSETPPTAAAPAALPGLGGSREDREGLCSG